jgi:hypothetical protein
VTNIIGNKDLKICPKLPFAFWPQVLAKWKMFEKRSNSLQES